MTKFVPELIHINLRETIKIETEQVGKKPFAIVYTIYKKSGIFKRWKPIYRTTSLKVAHEYFKFELFIENRNE